MLNHPHLSPPKLTVADGIDLYNTVTTKNSTRCSNILDHLFCASDLKVTNVEMGEPFGPSDQNCVRFTIELELKKSIIYDEVSNFRLVNCNGLPHSMASATVTLGRDTNQLLNKFVITLKSIELEHHPLKNRRSTVNRPKYSTVELRNFQSQKGVNHFYIKNTHMTNLHETNLQSAEEL